MSFISNYFNKIKKSFLDDILKNNILMKLSYILYKAPLHIAVSECKIEIIKLLLSNEQIKVNLMSILKTYH